MLKGERCIYLALSPSLQASARPHAASQQQQPPVIKTCTAPTQPTPSTAVATPSTNTNPSQPKLDLLGDLGGDPFGEWVTGCVCVCGCVSSCFSSFAASSLSSVHLSSALYLPSCFPPPSLQLPRSLLVLWL